MDIFTLREQAQGFDLRNRVGTTPVSWLVTPSDNPPVETAEGWVYDIPVVEQTQVCSECQNILTITDVGKVCRQCRLDWPMEGSAVL